MAALNEGSDNSPINYEEKWKLLFEALDSVKIESHPFGLDTAFMNSRLGAVGLIQPYNWNAWEVPFPESEEVVDMPLLDCVKQVTRIVRADRTEEGFLWFSITSGILGKICQLAYEKSGGGHIPSLSDLEAQK